ncbi:hypothetical protein CDV36_012740 [Fusarium kuroshium]|uniref:C2H2-type domain-containing protein n=1 Tax=Fusarium kuroshium TaxID=2010991 RepID=A0A3M2RR05_9HYPO|nr:hypothetical protein CDV36_012740 [Fusarium kuroshium]
MSFPSSAHVPNMIWLPPLLLSPFFLGRSASIFLLIVAFFHLERVAQKVSVQPARESRTIRRRLMRDKQRAKQPPFATMTGLRGIWHLFTTAISTARQQHGKRKHHHPPPRPNQAVVLQKVNSEPGASTGGDLAVDQSARPQVYRLFSCVRSSLFWLNIPVACFPTLAPPGTWTSSASVVPRQTESSYRRGQSNKRKSGKSEKDKKNEKKSKKQQRGKEKKNNSDDDDDSHRKKSHSDSVGGGSSETEEFWACPYYKFDPERHTDCVDRLKISKQHHVNQHLDRFHTMKVDYLCSTCGIKFSSWKLWEDHIDGAQNYNRCPEPYELFPDELEEFKKESRAKTIHMSEEKKWFYRWDFLFRGHPHPSSPFVEDADEERRLRLSNRLRQEFPEEIIISTEEHVLDVCFRKHSHNPSPRRIRAVPTPEHQVSATIQSPGTAEQTPALSQIPVLHGSSAADTPASYLRRDVFMGADEDEAHMWEI